MSKTILVRQKQTGKIIDVPADHWTLNVAEWPRGHDHQGRPIMAEEFELINNPDDYEFDMGEHTHDAMGNPRTVRMGEGWRLKKKTSSQKGSRSRSTRTKAAQESSEEPAGT